MARDIEKVRENQRRYEKRNRELLNEKKREMRKRKTALREELHGKRVKLTPEERRQRNIEAARRSNAARTPEDLARIREYRRRQRAEGKLPPSELWKLTPEGREKINEATRARRAAARAARPRAVYSSNYSPRPLRHLAPSFPECAAPSPDRDLLYEISSRIGKSDDRDDIIGQALLNVVEGMTIDEAVIRARRTVRAGASHLRYSVPFHDCHFL